MIFKQIIFKSGISDKNIGGRHGQLTDNCLFVWCDCGAKVNVSANKVEIGRPDRSLSHFIENNASLCPIILMI